MKKRLIINDIILITVVLIVLSVISLYIYSPSDSTQITVWYNGKIYGSFNLENDAIIKVGDSGIVLVIENGSAYISSSDCPDKICMKNLTIDKKRSDSASIVCLPNKVVIAKSNPETLKEVDAVAG